MNLNNLHEGLFNLFKKKVEPQMLQLTQEQRAMIKKHFKHSNVDMKMAGPDSKYVLEYNAHTTYGKGKIAFRNEDGVLKASVSYHRSNSDALNPKVMPLTHYDKTIESGKDMEKLISELE